MGGGAWYVAVHGVAEGRTRLSDFTFTFHFYALEKEMATHSSSFAWRIPGTEEPIGLLSMVVAQSWTRMKRLSSSSRACRILVPQGGIEPVPPAVEAQSSNIWTPREFPDTF